MRRTAPHLAVGKDMIEMRQDGAEVLLRHGKRRLDGRMDTRRLHALQDISCKLRLQQRFAARKCDAAAMTEERQVAQEHIRKSRARDRARIPCQRARGTGFDDALPERVVFRVAGTVRDAADEDVRLYIVPRRRPFRSELLSRRPRGFFAELAADAAFLKKERPARRRDALRIMAPAAIQRTTFEEYGRSDTGTIVRRKASNVKNRADTPQIAFVLLDRPCLRTTPPAASRPVPPQ